jgi:hypothetical protein
MRKGTSVVLLAAALVLSCGKGPIAPGGQGQPVAVSISIVGPSSIAPDETVPFTANAKMNDGTTENYTNKVTWRSSNTFLLTMSASGAASGKNTGETAVSASFGRLQATLNVMVIPSGTYRLSGTVLESGLPLDRASVVVVEGHGSGLATETDALGHYRLYGVRGDVAVRVSKAGYVSVTKAITVTAHDQLDFPDLAQVNAVGTLAGAYTLTLTASSNCPTTSSLFTPALPDYARRRSYAAVITQNGPVLNVAASGADFLIQNGRATVSPVEWNRAT